MTKITVEAVVMCGGMGRRMGRLAMKYGCKSLIPIEGSHAIEYVLRVLKVLELKNVFLCIDRDAIASKIERVAHLVNLQNVTMHMDRGFGTMNALYELQGKISSGKVLVLFGHHLIGPAHLRRILSSKQQTNDILVSLYKTSSDSLRKIVALEENSECRYLMRGTERSRLKRGEYYADVPYLVPRKFVDSQSSIPVRSYDAIKSWLDAENRVIGVESDSPHEFHTPRDLVLVREFARQLRRNS